MPVDTKRLPVPDSSENPLLFVKQNSKIVSKILVYGR